MPAFALVFAILTALLSGYQLYVTDLKLDCALAKASVADTLAWTSLVIGRDRGSELTKEAYLEYAKAIEIKNNVCDKYEKWRLK